MRLLLQLRSALIYNNLYFPEKQCGNLTAPANGTVQLSSRIHNWYWNTDTVSGEYGDVATFRCNHCFEFGKNASSEVEVFCNSTGKWNDETPTCQSMFDRHIFPIN